MFKSTVDCLLISRALPSKSWPSQSTVVDNSSHLAVIQSTESCVIFKGYLGHFILGIYRHLEHIGSCIETVIIDAFLTEIAFIYQLLDL